MGNHYHPDGFWYQRCKDADCSLWPTATWGSKGSAGLPQPVQSSNYYGIVSPYSAGNRTQSLPHGASLRPYSPAPPVPPDQRPKSQPVVQGAGQAPPKPQRSFQQAVVPMAGKGMRSTPAPTGPPPSIPSPRSGQPRTLDRRHDPQGAYRTTPERPYSAGPGYHTSPERRYEPTYHSSPERRTQDSGYLSSPERRLDHQRSFPGYSSSSYDDSFYGERQLYGSRSGSVTPVIDEEARIRVEFMERQLASLTGLVQKALQSEDNREAEVEAARQTFKELHLSPEMYSQLRHLRKQTKDLRLEVRNLRRMAQAQAVTARETVRDTCYKIKAMLAAVQGGEDHVCAERLRVSREEDLYRQDVMHLEKDLAELESQVEELRSNVINRRCRVNMSDVESMALVLSRASKTVADLKARFPSLQESLKAVMAAEMEVVVREEKFLKEEPERLENALRRCKKLTGTLVTLKRLASVQEQRHTGGGGGHHPPEKSASADGPHSDGEAHSARTFDSNPHTVIHVPPDGHQRAPRTENALDALLDELQTFTKPNDVRRDSIPGLTTPQRRLPSYPSSDSPVRSSQNFAPPIHPKPTGAIAAKLQISESGHKQSLNLSPSGSPIPEGKNIQEIYNRVGVSGGGLKQTLINGPDSLPNPGPPLPIKKVPPPPPPRTTSRSPLTSPTTGSGSLRDSVTYGHSRSFSEPANKNLTEAAVQRVMAARLVSREEAENVVKTSAINDESRRDQLSSNSSSSESVNSQEGLQMALQQQQQQAGLVGGMTAKLEGKDAQPGTPPRSRQELLEHRHQELLRKQKQLQEQYARLQQLQRGQVRFSPPRSALGDLKKTGSESNILSKTALSLTPSSGSLTHLAMTGSPSSMTLNPKLLSSGTGNPSAGVGMAKPQPPSKIFETDIL